MTPVKTLTENLVSLEPTLRFLLLVPIYILFVKFLLFYQYTFRTFRTITNYITLLHEKFKNSKKNWVVAFIRTVRSKNYGL